MIPVTSRSTPFARLLLVGAGLLLAAGVAFYFWNQQKIAAIDSYEECVAAGYPILESYPQQCMTPDKRRFVNEKASLVRTTLDQPVGSEPMSHDTQNPRTLPTQTDLTAGFAIYTNRTFRVFSASMYHNLSEDVYIEAANPNLVHVQKAGTTWDDFFATLPFSLTKDCLITGDGERFCADGRAELQFFINGKQATDALQRVILDGDKLLVTFGSPSQTELQRQLEQVPSP